MRCVCTVGAVACQEHPGRLKTKEEKIAFRKAWDARVAEAEEAGEDGKTPRAILVPSIPSHIETPIEERWSSGRSRK